MSELLNDSPTAVKIRDQILKAIGPAERIMYVADGQIYEPTGGKDFILHIGAVIVTNERLLVFESKMLGRASHQQVVWRDVEKSVRHPDGEVGIQKRGSRPLWKISIWEGKSYRTPLDKKRLDLLSLAIQDARSAVEAEKSAEAAKHDAEVSNDYEELKRRRGF